MKPIARELVEELSTWASESDSPTPPDALSEKVDAWLAALDELEMSGDSWPSGENLEMGCLFGFDSLPSMEDMDPGEIDYLLEGHSSDDRRGAIYAGAELTRAEKEHVLCSWIRQHFEDPELGSVTGYRVDRFRPGDGGDVVVVTYWHGDHLQNGYLAAVFRNPGEATAWLGRQGILDESLTSDEHGALEMAMREHSARGGFSITEGR